MGLWTFLAVCVVCGCALEAYRAYVKSKRVRGGDVARLEERVKALEGDGGLEERVRTLEAIVTDPARQLDRDIDRLGG